MLLSQELSGLRAPKEGRLLSVFLPQMISYIVFREKRRKREDLFFIFLKFSQSWLIWRGLHLKFGRCILFGEMGKNTRGDQKIPGIYL